MEFRILGSIEVVGDEGPSEIGGDLSPDEALVHERVAEYTAAELAPRAQRRSSTRSWRT